MNCWCTDIDWIPALLIASYWRMWYIGFLHYWLRVIDVCDTLDSCIILSWVIYVYGFLHYWSWVIDVRDTLDSRIIDHELLMYVIHWIPALLIVSYWCTWYIGFLHYWSRVIDVCDIYIGFLQAKEPTSRAEGYRFICKRDMSNRYTREMSETFLCYSLLVQCSL